MGVGGWEVLVLDPSSVYQEVVEDCTLNEGWGVGGLGPRSCSVYQEVVEDCTLNDMRSHWRAVSGWM